MFKNPTDIYAVTVTVVTT